MFGDTINRTTFRSVAVDTLPLAGLLIAIISIHILLPASFREQFVFSFDAFEPHTLLTAAYVHLNDAHLWSNVRGFCYTVPFAYLLCRLQGRRRWFWTSTLLFLTILPVLTQLTSYAAWTLSGVDGITIRGFSGVVSGYAGFVLAAHARDLTDRYDRWTVLYAVEGVVLLLLGVLLYRYPQTRSPAIIGLLVLTVGGLFGVVAYRGLQQAFTEQERTRVGLQVVISGAVVVVVVVVWFQLHDFGICYGPGIVPLPCSFIILHLQHRQTATRCRLR